MSRLLFPTIVIMNAILGLAVYVFGGTQVAPCLAGPAPDIQQRCYESWLANRGVLLQLLDTPIPGIAVFLLLTAATWFLTRRRGMA